MKKLTDDEATKLLSYVVIDWEKLSSPKISVDSTKKCWKDAGFLATDETPLEKARRHRTAYMDGRKAIDFRILAAYDAMEAYEAAITRLKASAWTGPLIDEYARYFYANRKRGIPALLPEAWLAQRKAGKGAE